MFFKKTRKFNVRKIIFSITRRDGAGKFQCEITGRLKETKVFFLRFYKVEFANPEEIVGKWGRNGFIKIDTREFLNTDQVDQITYRTTDHWIEK